MEPACNPSCKDGSHTLRLQVYKQYQYLLWALKHMKMTYFGLFGAPGIEPVMKIQAWPGVCGDRLEKGLDPSVLVSTGGVLERLRVVSWYTCF